MKHCRQDEVLNPPSRRPPWTLGAKRSPSRSASDWLLGRSTSSVVLIACTRDTGFAVPVLPAFDPDHGFMMPRPSPRPSGTASASESACRRLPGAILPRSKCNVFLFSVVQHFDRHFIQRNRDMINQNSQNTTFNTTLPYHSKINQKQSKYRYHTGKCRTLTR